MVARRLSQRVLQQWDEQPAFSKRNQLARIHWIQGRWSNRHYDDYGHSSRAVPSSSDATPWRGDNADTDDSSLDQDVVIAMIRHYQLELTSHHRRGRPKRGIALLICLFVLSLVSVWT